MINEQFEVIDLAQAFFPVELKDLFMETKSDDLFNGELQKLPRHFAVVDVEKQEPFSVVTDNYHLITNEKAYLDAEKIFKRVFNATTFENMVCMNITMPKTRSFCHIDMVHNNSTFEPWEKDEWSAFIRITNSYNRTKKLRYEIGFCRWICMNGMIFGAKSIEFSTAHTKKSKQAIERYVDNIGDIRKLEQELILKLKQLKRYYVPKIVMLALATKVFSIKIPKSKSEYNKKGKSFSDFKHRLNELSDDYFDDMGPHGYAALNVLTDFASRPTGEFSVENLISGYQSNCGEWVTNFIESIQDQNFTFDNYLKSQFAQTHTFEQIEASL